MSCMCGHASTQATHARAHTRKQTKSSQTNIKPPNNLNCWRWHELWQEWNEIDFWNLGDDRKTIGVIHCVDKIKSTAINRGWLLSQSNKEQGVRNRKAGGVKASVFPVNGFPRTENMRLDFPTETERTQGRVEREKPDWSSNSRLEKKG